MGFLFCDKKLKIYLKLIFNNTIYILSEKVLILSGREIEAFTTFKGKESLQNYSRRIFL